MTYAVAYLAALVFVVALYTSRSNHRAGLEPPPVDSQRPGSTHDNHR